MLDIFTNIELIIFDLDGTLVDTEPLGAHACQIAIQTWGHQLETSDICHCTGRSWPSIIAHLKERFEIPLDDQELQECIIYHYSELTQSKLPTLPGAVAAVERFAKSYDLAIVSGSTSRQIQHAISMIGVDHCFKATFGIDQYHYGKPHPTGFELCRDSFGVDSAQCLVFEDSQAGILAAKAAGMRAVAVCAAGFSAHQDLTAADYQIDSFQSLLEKLEQG